jgi:predicted AlkP superfamily phosphohydrolase/phosphomutase
LSPVAWGNFITGADSGRHGIFDFVHRDPQNQDKKINSSSHVIQGKGAIGFGDYLVQLTFWPFRHRPPEIVSGRKGVPFWEYLDKASIASHVYMMPSNFPPSRSEYGNHRSLSGMGTPDIVGTNGTYQYFAEDVPARTADTTGMKLNRIVFKNNAAEIELTGPNNIFLKKPQATIIKCLVHRDRHANSAVLEIQNERILLKQGQWSDWTRLDFELSKPGFDKHISGICRFYLQEASPNFRLYTSPINIDPADPAMRISEPPGFSKRIYKELGPFYTVGFQEDYRARNDNILNDDEYARQADMVLKERLNLLEYALKRYEDGLLFFYFSSTDLQAHIFWWDSDKKHPFRSRRKALEYNNRIKQLYQKMDDALGELLERYGNEATIFALSDHGFANFERVFNLNSWLRSNGYISPSNCSTLDRDQAREITGLYNPHVGVDWSKTRAYGLGMNSLYLNLKGREKEGIVEPDQRDKLLEELTTKLEAVRDVNGRQIIRKVYRADKVYSGPEVELSPDLIMGYCRGYRADLKTMEGILTREVLKDNTIAWTADHCFDPDEIPGVLFCNKPIGAEAPTLVDLAPTILAEFGVSKPATMTGSNVLTS